jgi:hypothetical protein
MVSPPDSAAQKRAKWRSYFEQRLTGTDAEVDAATEAAMRALERGADVNGIIAAGLEGAKIFRTHGRVPPPSGAPRADTPPPPPRDHAQDRRSAAGAAGAASSARSGSSRASAGSRAGAAVGSATSGVVTGMQQRQEVFGRTYFTVWSFRLERTDSAGHPMTPIPVEMRGRRFKGSVNNGDLVDVRHRPPSGKLVQTRRVRNLTLGTDVRTKGRRHPILQALFVLVFLAGAALWIFYVTHSAGGNGFQP